MCRRYNRLLFLGLSAVFIIMMWGCSQPDDIMTPASTTKLILRPERLPTLPNGMIYELWVKNDDNKPISLGKFNWNSELYQFHDSAGNKMDSLWTVNFDALKYKWICLSVETYPDLEPDSMGPVMLQDTIADPEKKPIKMLYPIDLWLGQAGYAVTTPTDGNSYVANGSGVWFALYIFDTTRSYFDTTGAFTGLYNSKNFQKRLLKLDTIGWDSTIEPPIPLLDTLEKDSLSHALDTVGLTNVRITIDSNFVILLDTFVHTSVVFDYATIPINVGSEDIYDTVLMVIPSGKEESTEVIIPPFADYHLPDVYYGRSNEKTQKLDNFLLNAEELPDLAKAGPGQSDIKWHYKGWVISPYLKPDSSFGKLTKPSWSSIVIENLLSPPSAGVISTGSFKDFEGPDDSNSYSMNKRVPAFPGEDFLVHLPQGIGPDGITFGNPSDPSERSGTVFVTLEPDNYNNSTTNFPLILMMSEERMPSLRTVSDKTLIQDFRLANWFRAVDGDMSGFPAIHVKLIRE